MLYNAIILLLMGQKTQTNAEYLLFCIIVRLAITIGLARKLHWHGHNPLKSI